MPTTQDGKSKASRRTALQRRRPHELAASILAVAVLTLGGTRPATGQLPAIQYGEQVPAEVKMIYERGLEYLAQTQQEDGAWTGQGNAGGTSPRGHHGAAVTGLCLMAFLAHGEDPNFGRYHRQIQRAVQSIIAGQDAHTGYLQGSMYHHGFGMLALAEAYGAIDEAQLDASGDRRTRSIGEALELAVRCAVTGQSKEGGWRYTPGSGADTSVSGAVLMGLLAARNAGIEVPDETVDKALVYFQGMTSSSGTVSYASSMAHHGSSMNRSAIATLVYSIGKRSEWPQLDATKDYITQNLEHQEASYSFYFRYYMAQALFQSDYESWTKWKRLNVEVLRNLQNEDGHFDSSFGTAYGTAMALLSLALEYRYLPIYER